MHVEYCGGVPPPQLAHPTVLWKSNNLNCVCAILAKLFQWPFIRFFGIQEPASAFFSLLNFYAHVKMIKRFRKEVPSDSPLYWLWHYFCFVSKLERH
jgi:hypothetical protein